MITAFASPSTYVQGDRLLQHAARYIAPFGNHGLLIADDIVWELVGGQFYQHLTADGLKIEHIHFNGESSRKRLRGFKLLGRPRMPSSSSLWVVGRPTTPLKLLAISSTCPS